MSKEAFNVKMSVEEFYKQIPKLKKGRIHIVSSEELQAIVRLAKEDLSTL